MSDNGEDKLIPILRLLAKAINQESGFSNKDIEKAKALATKLYVMHTNRELTLSSTDFRTVLEILEFGD